MEKQCLPKIDFPFKSTDNKLFFDEEWTASFPAMHKEKKTFLSQSMQSPFVKLFAHVLLIVYGKILQLKMQRNNFISFGLLELKWKFGSVFLKKNTFFL
jgi:hypothetical protein